MPEEKSVKESLELLKGVELLALDYSKVMADGKVDVKDLVVVVDLATQFSQLSEAAKGVDQIGKELADLNEAEILALAGAGLAIVKAFKKPAA